MLKKYWRAVDGNPIGDFIPIGKGMGAESEDEPRQIIGVGADVREAGLGREPIMYVPASQLPDAINALNNPLLPPTSLVHTPPPSPPPSAPLLRPPPPPPAPP